MNLKPLTVLDQRIFALLPEPAPKPLEPAAEPSEPPTPEWIAAQALSVNTYRSYRTCLRDFVSWAGLDFPFPTTPHLVAQYLTDRRTKAYKTLRQYVHALSYIHRKLSYPDPTKDPFVKNVLQGLGRIKARTGGTGDVAPAFTLEQFRAVIAAIDAAQVQARARLKAITQRIAQGQGRPSAENQARGQCLRIHRDRAYLLLGLFGGFRQSELNNITLDRVVKDRDGLVIPMGVVKQDQTDQYKFVKAIPFGPDDLCPVRTLEGWLEASGIVDGPVFRAIGRWGTVRADALSHTATNDIIKHWAKKAGLPRAEHYSGHSLRASFVTILRDLGVPDAQIGRQTHHRNLQMIQTYDRSGNPFRGNAVTVLAKALSAT